MTGLGAKTKAVLAKMIRAEIIDWPTPAMGDFLDDEGCSDAEAAEIVTELAEIAAAMGVDLRAMASQVSAELRETETEGVDIEPVPTPRNTLPN